MRASYELQFGALREGGGTREAGSTVAESVVVLYRVGTHQISSELQFGALREGGGTLEAGSTVAERVAVLYRVRTIFDEGGG